MFYVYNPKYTARNNRLKSIYSVPSSVRLGRKSDWDGLLVGMPLVRTVGIPVDVQGGITTTIALDGNAKWSGRSMDLDGVSGTAVNLGDTNVFTSVGTGEWAAEFFVLVRSLTGITGNFGMLLGKDESSQREWTFGIGNTGYFSGGFFNTSTGNLRWSQSATGLVEANKVYHLVSQRVGNTIELYINGLFVATDSGTQPGASDDPSNTTSTAYLGRRGFASFEGDFNIKMYMFNFYDRSLAAGEIARKARDPLGMYMPARAVFSATSAPVAAQSLLIAHKYSAAKHLRTR